MAQYLKQSTAGQEIQLGKFVDDTDGKAAETGLTIANTDIKLFKHGATAQASKNSGGGTHMAAGYYSAVLDATDTDTVGNLEVTVDVAGALSVRREYVVLEEAVYDAMFAASAPGFATVAALQTVDNEIATLQTSVNTIDTEVGVIDGIVDSILEDTGTTIPATLTTIDNEIATIDTVVDAILVDTAEIGAAGAGLTVLATQASVNTIDTEIGVIDGIVDEILVDTGTTIPAQITALNNLSAAQVNAEVDTALADIHLDHLLATDYDPASKPGTATALLNELVESDAGVSRFTANALELAPTGGSAPSAADIADAVWDEALAGHTTAGSYGKAVADIESDATAILEDTGTTLQAELDGIQADTEDIQSRLPAALVSGRIDSSVGAMAADTVTASAVAADAGTEIGTAVWATTVRALTDKSGFALSSAGIQAIWDALTSALTTVGSIGKLLVDNINATIGSRSTQASVDTIAGYLDTEIAAILADTNELQTDWADGGRLDAILDARASQASVDAVAGYVDTEVAAIKTVTDKLDDTLEDQGGGLYGFTPEALQEAPTGGSAPTAEQIADAVWDEPIAGHATAGSTGATLSSRATQTSVDTVAGYVDTEVAAIKAKTDNLPADPASAATIAGEFVTVNSKLDTLDDYVDTEIAAIKQQTDLIPGSPAAVGSPMTLASGAIGATTFAPNAVDANALAANAVAEIQSGLATQAAVETAIDEVGDKVTDMWQNDGLDIANPMTVTPTTRVAGGVNLALTGNGVTSKIVTRQP